MDLSDHLLDDEQIRGFITDGYVHVQTELPDKLHGRIWEKTASAFAGADSLDASWRVNPLNNILPQVSEIQQVLDAPQVRGALTSLLGPGYIMHPHRHCHPNYPRQDDGGRDQRLIMPVHKDGHAGGARPRHRNPRWAILFYYPQECPPELGPTCILPGTQHVHRLSSDPDKAREFRDVSPRADGSHGLPDHFACPDAIPLAGPLGRVWIMHFDLGHSVVENVLDKVRWGQKFVFMRTQQPDGPSWNSQVSAWCPPQSTRVEDDRELLWTSLWNWMYGAGDLFATERATSTDVQAVREQLQARDAGARLRAANELGFMGAAAAEAVSDLSRALEDDYEPIRATAACALGAIGSAAVEPLMQALNHEREAAFYADNPTINVSNAAHGLALVGAPAASRLIDALTATAEHVRASAAYALGEMGAAAAPAVDGLIATIADPSVAVARHAVSALGMIGEPADRIVDAIVEAYDTADDQGLRSYMMQACVRLGPKAYAAIPTLERATRDDFAYVRAFAVEALARIDTSDALRAMVPFLRTMRWFPHERRNT